MGGLVAWLRVGQTTLVLWSLGDVTAIEAPGLLRHLPSISDLGINIVLKVQWKPVRQPR